MKLFIKKTSTVLLFIFFLASAAVFSRDRENNGITAKATLELGIDSLQQKYLRPILRYDFPLRLFTIFGEVDVYQRAGDHLKGAIDYWLNIGLYRGFGERFAGELRLNHMCRHLSFQENPDIFNLNEVLARGWFRGTGFRLGLGLGTYTGGNQDYRSLLVLNGEFPGLFGTELTLSGEVKLRDFQELLHEVELSFALNRSTDLFIRNTRHYQFENTTFIGIRLKSEGRLLTTMESLKLSTGFYTHYQNHKILVEAQFRMAFFRTDFRKLIFALDFVAPIIRDNGFWGDFYPENMAYGFCLEYERNLRGGWFVGWISRYSLDIPLDIEQRFFSNLGTGIRLKNQTDFDLLERTVRLEVSAGYNFTFDYDLNLKLGLNLLKLKRTRLETEALVRLNNTKIHSSFKMFMELGRTVSIRPFLRFDLSDDRGMDEPAVIKFLIGVHLIKWYRS